MLHDPACGSARWVWGQYDSLVGSGTVLGPGADAAVLRLPGADGTQAVSSSTPQRGVAVATDGNGRRCALDPAEGARQLVCEATRNVACTGARPLAITNCLNFGSPERPEIMGALAATVAGMAEACEALGTPVTGGNVSLYNQTGGVGVHPTPVIGALGVLEHVADRVGLGLGDPGDLLYQVGAPTRPGLAGSAWQRATGRPLAGRLPAVDLRLERALQDLLVAAADRRLLRSAHDVADGGVALCLLEACLDTGRGARLEPEPGVDLRQCLFSEAPTRALVSLLPARADQFEQLCAEIGVPARRAGAVTDSGRIELGPVTLELASVRRLYEEALPLALGEQVAVGATG